MNNGFILKTSRVQNKFNVKQKNNVYKKPKGAKNAYKRPSTRRQGITY